LRVHQVSPRIAAHQITNGMNGSHLIKFFMGLFRQSSQNRTPSRMNIHDFF
jgi:hypothetical protein